MNTLVTPPGYHRSWRALIAAKISGTPVTVQDFVPGKTDKDPQFLAFFPPNTVTFFKGEDKTMLFDVNAIAYYLGNETTRDRLSQADITLYTALYPLFTHVFDENYRKPLPHLVRWYTTVGNQPYILGIVGTPVLCVKEASFDAAKYAQLHPKDFQTGETKVAKLKPKVNKPKVHAEEDDDDEKEHTPKPSKNPMAELPDGGFDMNEFKRTYSNNDVETVALPYFWQRFDPATHSLWFCEYLFPEELGKIFMTCNLVNGMFQRLQKMQRFAFASMCIFGDDTKSSISGVWFWPGTGLAFDLDPDFQVDYESYSWTKLDPNTAESKTLVHEYFTQQFKDKPFNQGKVFK